MKINMNKLVLGLALLSSAGIVQAESGPKWNFLSASYQSADVEDETLSGLGVSGSALLGSNVFIAGGFASIGTEIEGVDIDLNSTSLGLGLRHALSATTDIFGVVSYQKAEVEISVDGEGFSVDGNGHGLELGVRSLLTNQFELAAKLQYVDIEDEGETGFSVSGLFHINDTFGVGAGYATADDVDTLSIIGVLFF